MAVRDATKKELVDLVKEGRTLADGLQNVEDGGKFTAVQYQSWYSRALRAVELLAPDRYEEFRRYYEPDPKRKDLGYGSYVIQDLFKGVAPSHYSYPDFDTIKQASGCFLNQVNLLAGLIPRLDSVLANLEVELQAEMADAEIESARRLLSVNLRAAGVIAGVVLEEHLAKTCASHGVKFRKKNPTLSDYNDALRDAGLYQTATWRKVSYLGDIRNTCAHKKSDDPTRDQVVELIDGTTWVTANVL